MKKLFFSIIILGVLIVVNTASALTISLDNWGFNPSGGDTPSITGITEFTFTGVSFIDYGSQNYNAQDATFDQLGTFNGTSYILGEAVYNGGLNNSYQITAVLEATGKNTSITGDDVDFEFSTAVLTFYVDTVINYGTTADFYGAEGGTQIAQFTLYFGDGNMDFSSKDGNTDILFTKTSMATGYFFDADGHDLTLSTEAIFGMTDSNNDVIDASATKIDEWIERGALVDGDSDSEVWASTDGSFKVGSAVPVPTTMLLLGLGLIGLTNLNRRS